VGGNGVRTVSLLAAVLSVGDPWTNAATRTEAAATVLAPPAPARKAEVDEVLHRAGVTVAGLEGRLAVAVATEEYSQRLTLGGNWFGSRRVRELVSEAAWVPTGDALVWAFFRDVFAVDGRPIKDRTARLQRLFSSGATPEAREQAAAILGESARYNLGPRRTINSPTVVLSFLHPRNQPRFRFEARGEETVEGLRVLTVRFAETGHPTLVQTSTGIGIPARGMLRIEPEGGILVSSELHLDVPGLGPIQIRVRYRPQPRLEAWLPAEMREDYGLTGEAVRLETVAKYSDYRKAEVEVQEIQPVR